ncbi:MAG: hypothetical protein AAGC57_19390 [Pseudomonadota bacterium]
MWRARWVRRAESGASVVELLIAVAVMGLIASVMIIALQPTDRQRLRGLASQIVLFIEEARLSAARTGGTVVLSFDREAHAYEAGGRTFHLPNGVEVGRTGGLPNNGRLMLRPSGESAGAEIPLALGSDRVDIRLDWLTGRLEVQP